MTEKSSQTVGDAKSAATAHIDAKYLTGVGVLLAVGAVLAAAFSTEGYVRLQQSYLVALLFALSIPLGSLFFVLIHYLCHARWSTSVIRLCESITVTLYYAPLLFIPIAILMLAGDATLFPWLSAEKVANDPLIAGKTPYLNLPFFLARAGLYFLTWGFLAVYFHRNSIRHDQADDRSAIDRMRTAAGPAMFAFAITVCFATFDWIMSLEPHWFSTILGVYYFAGCMVAFFSALILLALTLEALGLFQGVMKPSHVHDLGKYLFGFVFFWGYIAFSQYLLIWYSNIPEETQWYLARQQNGWQYLSLGLLLGHFIVPFFGLMSRSAKTSRASLAAWSCWLLVMHWLDLYWLVAPSVTPERVWFGAPEVLCLASVVLLAAVPVVTALRKHDLVAAVHCERPADVATHS